MIIVSLMYYQFWFWYPAAVTVTSWYWFPIRLTESYFPEMLDDKPVRNPLWPWYGQGQKPLIFLILLPGSEMLLQRWHTFPNTSPRLPPQAAHSLSSKSRAALVHVTQTLIRTATDCHLHARAPVSRWEVARKWGKDSGTSGPVCLTDPKGAVRSVVIVAIVDTITLPSYPSNWEHISCGKQVQSVKRWLEKINYYARLSPELILLDFVFALFEVA